MLCLVVQTLNFAIEKIAFGKRDSKDVWAWSTQSSPKGYQNAYQGFSRKFTVSFWFNNCCFMCFHALSISGQKGPAVLVVVMENVSVPYPCR